MTGPEHAASSEEVRAYLDGELAPERAREILAHLAGCAACRQLADDLRGVSHQMSTWSVEHPPAGLRLPEVDAVAPPTVRRPFWRRPAVWVVAPAAAVVLAAAIVGNLPRSSVQPEAARTAPARSVEPRAASVGRPAVGAATEAVGISTGGRVVPGQPAASPGGPLIARTARLQVLVEKIDASRSTLERIVRDEQPSATSRRAARIAVGPRDAARRPTSSTRRRTRFDRWEGPGVAAGVRT